MRINLHISKIWSSYNCGLPLCFGSCTIAGVYDYFNFEYFHGSYCILCKTFSMDLEVSGLSFPVFDFWLDTNTRSFGFLSSKNTERSDMIFSDRTVIRSLFPFSPRTVIIFSCTSISFTWRCNTSLSRKPEEYRREIIILCLVFVMDCRSLCTSFRLKIVGRCSSFWIPYAKSKRIGFRGLIEWLINVTQ
jgi:hypothetical protein